MIAIVGAGMAGLSCAHQLVKTGQDVVVFDKGRGLGGRIATRRTGFGSFDHGAQYATAKGDDFAGYLARLSIAGSAARWNLPGREKDRYVGSPGMTSLVKPLAENVTVHREIEITGIRRSQTDWHLTDASGTVFGPYTALVLTPPAPQTLNLLGDYAAAFPGLRDVKYAPCWTLMAAFDGSLKARETVIRGEGVLDWVACNSSKPGRDAMMETWVAQASPCWSRDQLEQSKNEVARRMLAEMLVALDVPSREAVYLQAHRWRYARVEQAVGQTFLFDRELNLGIAGDGLLGGRIEAAYESGHALGRHLSP